MEEQLFESNPTVLDCEASESVIKLSKRWLNQEFVDLSGISDQRFLDTMTTMGYRIRFHTTHDDTIFEFGINSDRPDCCCVIGLAREVAAAFNRPMKHHKPTVKGCDDSSIYEFLDIDVPAEDLCNRYTARMISNAKIAQSPEWLRQRLEDHGIQPVNNIIDITNYVMLEYGQRIQAFDYRCVSQGEMLVRVAEDGEVLITADDISRQLKGGMLIAAADDHPIGIAGVIYGNEAKISNDTEMIVFEAASLDSSCIHYTANTLGIQIDAPQNPDPMVTIPAIERACELVELLECGEVLDGIIDILNYVPEPKTLELEPKKLNQLLGNDISEEEIVSYLKRLEIPVEGRSILLPSFRSDIHSMSGIADEVKRLQESDKVR